MRKIYKIAFLSFFFGMTLLVLSAMWMVSDSAFDMYREWNKLTVLTTLFTLAYGAICVSFGIALCDKLNKNQ